LVARAPRREWLDAKAPNLGQEGQAVPVVEYSPASIDADSPMTPEYRATLIKLLADQVRAELVAAHIYSRWVSRVREPEEKMRLAELAREETEHWYKTVKLLGELGVSSEAARRHRTRSWFYMMARLLVPRMTWLDVAMGAFLIDSAAYILVEDFAQSSYTPWAQTAQGILKDEVDHPAFGSRCLRKQIEQRGVAPVQRTLKKWWRVSLNLFGPPVTKNTDLYIRLGLKVRTNEDRREVFRRALEPQIRALGLEVPRLSREKYPFF
jgi:ring-1,2-phenylacetyl-CoA epoxidase subunit PaaA